MLPDHIVIETSGLALPKPLVKAFDRPDIRMRVTVDGVVETTLAVCAADAARAGFAPPALVVIGEVVRFRQSLDWLGVLGGRSLAADPLGTRSESETG